MNNKFFNQNILFAIPIFFILLVIFRVSFAYSDIKKKEYHFAKNEAEVLSSYFLEHRNYYQKLFINKTIIINNSTLTALPAYSSRPISNHFSKNNVFNIEAKTVSDRPRNPKNKADKSELKAITFFKNNINEIKYFDNSDKNIYQYAQVLRITDKCLTCHGNKKDAPKFIQKKYANAYNYKLGDLRGIISIKIQKKELENYFYNSFYISIAYDILLITLLFTFIYYLTNKFKNINTHLNKEVSKKTNQLLKSKLILEELLIRDKLTNQLNREKLIKDINTHKKNSKNIHLALLNINSFKNMNDFYGHKIADKLLISVADLLQNILVKRNFTLYKLPSDEYAIINFEEISDDDFIKNIDNILNKLISKPHTVENHKIFITFSCGIASSIDSILVKADIALQKSKHSQDSIVVYNQSMSITESLEKNLKTLSLIKEAINKDNIIPYFQPIYNLHTNKIEKYESLARIVLEDGQILTPYHFMDVAIKSKLYPYITKAMIQKSFAYFRNKEYEFSINFSMDDVLNKETVAYILNELENFNSPQRVVFEILETEKVNDYEALSDFIKKLKSYGSKVAIDDFGSGYSNFAYILELNIDYLKIDASLVKNITTNKNSKAITKTIINFAKDLNIKTISEFVEDKESIELLKEMGSDYAQGYYIGKPEPELVKSI